MDLVSIATSTWGPSGVSLLCRTLRREQTCQLGDVLAERLQHQPETTLIRALRANMCVVLGVEDDDPVVDRTINRLLKNMMYGYIDLFRTIEDDEGRAIKHFEMDDSLDQLIALSRTRDRGLIFVGTHTCSFDLLMLALLEYFPSIQALTNSNPQGSSKVMNDLRARYGFEITPISSTALRKAITRLRNGGVVAIANDVPVENGGELVFFGERCNLPVGHARLAQMTDAQMVVGASFQLGGGLYKAKAKIIPPPVSFTSKSQKIRQWAQDTLATTEEFIQQKPDEWLMPQPLWSSAE